MTTASVCTVGDEILIGQIVDTNSSAISRALGSLGIRVKSMESIGDSHSEIISSLERLLRENDIVITTGGLGPTKDDITKKALAELSGASRYIEYNPQLEIIHKILSSRGLDLLPANRAQALVPDTCEVITNNIGTAPVMVFRMAADRFGHPATLYALPGVPFEAEAALPDVLADIKAHQELNPIWHRNLMTYGLAESALAKKIAPWEDALPEDIHLAYLPNPLTGVRLRLSVYSGSAEEEKVRVEAEISKLKAILGDAVYSDEDDNLQHALGELLKAHGLSLSAAESCTGGEIAHLVTSVPGSSAYFLGSVTSYAVSVKENVLGVPSETIRGNGIVSSEVAEAMARGVRRLTGSDYSVATTGYAGPGGGDERYPEGTVWVGVDGPAGSRTKMFRYNGDRERNIERFAASALHFLLTIIKEEQKD